MERTALNTRPARLTPKGGVGRGGGERAAMLRVEISFCHLNHYAPVRKFFFNGVEVYPSKAKLVLQVHDLEPKRRNNL